MRLTSTGRSTAGAVWVVKWKLLGAGPDSRPGGPRMIACTRIGFQTRVVVLSAASRGGVWWRCRAPCPNGSVAVAVAAAAGGTVETIEARQGAVPAAGFTCRNRGAVDAGLCDGLGHQAHRLHRDLVGDREMPGNPGTAADQAIAPDPGRAGHRDAAGHRGMCADHHV